MTDQQPRQLMPETESHQNLSSKLGASRPAPPRNRSRATVAQNSRQNRKDGSASEAAETSDADALESSNDTQASTRSSLTKADLEGEGTASPVPMAIQRTTSGSYRSASDQHNRTQEIPKEEIEKALEGLDRDDLVVALGRAKVQMDEIEARLNDQLLENETLHASSAQLAQQLGLAEADAQSLQAALKQREDRIDEMMADQDRMESEVFSTMQVIERLRKQLAETEKSRNDAEKRYVDQTATMDKERQYYADTEALLKSQKATQASAYEKLLSNHNELLKEHERVTNRLASIKASGVIGTEASESGPMAADNEGIGQDSRIEAAEQSEDGEDQPRVDAVRTGIPSSASTRGQSFADEKELFELREELATTQKSHSSLSDTIATLQAELRDVRTENVTLRDQNETFMDILQEKTFSGALLNESAMLRGLRASSGRFTAQKGLAAPYDSDEGEFESTDLDEDGESETTGSASTIPEENEDEVDDVPDTPRAPTTDIKKSRRRPRKQSSSFLHPPSDLASELEQIDDIQQSPEIKARREKRLEERTGIVSESVQELQREVRELREANQALTLYISKIIDRIIAKEGYEHILAIDGRGTVRGARRKASRAALSSAVQGSTDSASNSRNVSNTSTSSATSSSGGFFSFGAGSSQTSATTPSETTKSSKPKSKRASSIDWRSLPFLGGGTSNNTTATKPDGNPTLRPLTLQSTNLTVPAREGSARKLRTSEEIEDERDVAEREQIRKELLRRGIEPPKHQLVQSPSSPHVGRPQSMSINTAGAPGGFAAFFSRVVGGNGPGALLSPGAKSDTLSQASTTPGRSSETGFDPSISSSTPARVENRGEERTRALQLSEGEGGLTRHARGQSIATRARLLRAERQQQSLDAAAGTSGDAYNLSFPSSSASSSRATSGTPSLADSSILENSIAGDESYSLPPPPQGISPAQEYTDSPLLGYGATLPPLPAETTGDEDPTAYRSPLSSQTQELKGSTDQGWKRALRRISLLSSASGATTNSGSRDGVASPSETPHGSELAQSPLNAATTLPATSNVGEHPDP